MANSVQVKMPDGLKVGAVSEARVSTHDSLYVLPDGGRLKRWCAG